MGQQLADAVGAHAYPLDLSNLTIDELAAVDGFDRPVLLDQMRRILNEADDPDAATAGFSASI